jgi:hypothetical protein
MFRPFEYARIDFSGRGCFVGNFSNFLQETKVGCIKNALTALEPGALSNLLSMATIDTAERGC